MEGRSFRWYPRRILLESGAWVASLDLNQSSGTAEFQAQAYGYEVRMGAFDTVGFTGCLTLKFCFCGGEGLRVSVLGI